MRRSRVMSGNERVVPHKEPASHGTATWSSPQWRDEAVSWLDGQLAAVGIDRTGDVEQPHLRPWATVLRVPTTKVRSG